mmetsp:Transcript_15959/g.25276  ORF Transcript_15959/g.25276 Transcript_15959/m.25276 type:complete len:225 (-) Transcript_15959:54-728(-)
MGIGAPSPRRCVPCACSWGDETDPDVRLVVLLRVPSVRDRDRLTTWRLESRVRPSRPIFSLLSATVSKSTSRSSSALLEASAKDLSSCDRELAFLGIRPWREVVSRRTDAAAAGRRKLELWTKNPLRLRSGIASTLPGAFRGGEVVGREEESGVGAERRRLGRVEERWRKRSSMMANGLGRNDEVLDASRGAWMSRSPSPVNRLSSPNSQGSPLAIAGPISNRY